jgi:hypothetical protein
MAIPASTCGRVERSGPTVLTPAATRRATNSRFSASSKNATTERGDRGPDALGGGEIGLDGRVHHRVEVPNAWLMLSDADGPRCFIAERREQVAAAAAVRDAAMDATSFSALMLRSPSSCEELVDGEEVDVGRIADEPGVAELEHGALAEPSMSIAPRDAK